MALALLYSADAYRKNIKSNPESANSKFLNLYSFDLLLIRGYPSLILISSKLGSPHSSGISPEIYYSKYFAWITVLGKSNIMNP